MCCHINQCCCGCTDLKTGITVAAFFDMFMILILGTLNFIFLHNYGAFWGVILVIADIMLICGAMANNTGLMILWMIICMINIVFLFIGWIAIPVVIFFHSICDTMNSDSDFWYETNTDYYSTNTRTLCGDRIQVSLLITAGFVFILPIYYLYLWIVVKSHRMNLMRQQSNIQPISGYQGQQMFVAPNNSLMRPQQPQVLPGPNLTTMYYQPTPLVPQYDNSIQQPFKTEFSGFNK